MKQTLTMMCLLALSACTAQTGPGAPTQLERLVGLSPQEYGRYSPQQLALMKHAMEDDDSTISEREHRVGLIKDGTFPRFGFSF